MKRSIQDDDPSLLLSFLIPAVKAQSVIAVPEVAEAEAEAISMLERKTNGPCQGILASIVPANTSIIKAEEVNINPNSKEHKRIKFKNAPTALIVYVSEKQNVKLARRKLFDHFGEIDESGQLPILPDGSKMIFSLIIQGPIKNNQAFNNLSDSLTLQAMVKADEILLPLNVSNIFKAETCMQNRSLENIIHSMVLNTSQVKGIPIFTHITRKRMRDPSVVRYEVAVQTKLKKRQKKY